MTPTLIQAQILVCGLSGRCKGKLKYKFEGLRNKTVYALKLQNKGWTVLLLKKINKRYKNVLEITSNPKEKERAWWRGGRDKGCVFLQTLSLHRNFVIIVK